MSSPSLNAIRTARSVDPDAWCSSSATIYEEEDGVAWQAVLNFTDISCRSNKFFKVDLIRDGDQFSVFYKSGRVGTKYPQRNIAKFGSLEKAKRVFQKHFAKRTGNIWPLQGPFVKKQGKYALVGTAGEECHNDAKQRDAPPCTLPEQVQDLLKWISDWSSLVKEVSRSNIVAPELPLGRLSQTQISQGYALLQQLSDTISALEGLEQSARTTRQCTVRRRILQEELTTLSSDFYSLIPHKFGTRSHLPAISTAAHVKEKTGLLELVTGIEISQQLQEEAEKSKADIHPLDVRYRLLNTTMEPLNASDEEYQRILRYVESTECTASQGYKLNIVSVIKVARGPEEVPHAVFKSIDNHKLLWHGTRLSNIVGILSQGLQVAPQGVPVSGSSFGRGIYFSDSVARASAFCLPTSAAIAKRVLVLAEVALGKSYEAFRGEHLTYETVQKRGFESTHAMGRMIPSEDTFEIMDDGVVVPIGKLTPRNLPFAQVYNEFVVYRPDQIKLRYLVAFEFVLLNALGS